MNYSIYSWNFRIVILNFYFIFNYFNIYCKAQLNIFIETARYKFQFIIIIINIILTATMATLSSWVSSVSFKQPGLPHTYAIPRMKGNASGRLQLDLVPTPLPWVERGLVLTGEVHPVMCLYIG